MRQIFSAIIAAASVALAPASGANSQTYPTRPVRVITLTAAGGSLDIMARGMTAGPHAMQG
jgi:tripartite-type tricarboxylate transporter receptor subunit TctC